MSATEGITKFALTFRQAAPPPPQLVAELIRWRQELVALDVVGQDPQRYDGIGFGNLSRRHPGRPDAFIITGTQTGGMTALGCHDFAIVTAHDCAANALTAHGGRPPSSEALTHGALYRGDPRIHWVFHGHAPHLWRAAARLRIPVTPADMAYGTPVLANVVAAMMKGLTLPGLLAMGGHEDGVIACGATADSTGELLGRQLRRAPA